LHINNTPVKMQPPGCEYILWGSQSWLQPPFRRLLRAATKLRLRQGSGCETDGMERLYRVRAIPAAACPMGESSTHLVGPGGDRAKQAKLRAVSTGDKLLFRPESPEDERETRLINQAAFGRPDEADLVDRLRAEGVVIASLVAEEKEWDQEREEKRLVAHILFSRMSIETSAGSVAAVALAPIAVSPELQRRGIGGKLIRYGLDLLRARGERIVIVLGDPDYYPRFGFSRDKARFLESPFPPEAFMALELQPGALDGVRGKVRYAAAFGLPEPI
jgi:putative acetyltransferase